MPEVQASLEGHLQARRDRTERNHPRKGATMQCTKLLERLERYEASETLWAYPRCQYGAMIGECPYAGCLYRRGDHDEPAVCSQATTILRGNHDSVENNPGRTVLVSRDCDNRARARQHRHGSARRTAPTVAGESPPHLPPRRTLAFRPAR